MIVDRPNPHAEDVLRPLKLAIALFKLPFLLVGSPILGYVAASELHTALLELSPTQFQVERFAGDYRGQRWLSVEGRLLAKFANVENGDNATAKVHVPLVPNDWKPDQAVHIVGTFVVPSEKVDKWLESTTRSPKCSLTGYVPPGSPFWYSATFPTLHFEEPVVYINDGDSPVSPLRSLAVLTVGVGLLIYSWLWPLRLIASWWRRRQARAAAREEAEWAKWK